MRFMLSQARADIPTQTTLRCPRANHRSNPAPGAGLMDQPFPVVPPYITRTFEPMFTFFPVEFFWEQTYILGFVDVALARQSAVL
jgi:hypothetical protein